MQVYIKERLGLYDLSDLNEVQLNSRTCPSQRSKTNSGFGTGHREENVCLKFCLEFLFVIPSKLIDGLISTRIFVFAAVLPSSGSFSLQCQITVLNHVLKI